MVQLVAVAVLGALWGAAWQRSAALTEIASLAPALLVVIGPGLLVAYLALRIATGAFELRITGYGAAVAVVAALVGNLVTPGLSPSIEVGGHLTGTLDGAQIDDTAATRCTWGPGRTSVTEVTYKILGAPLTALVPVGQLTIQLPSGAVFIDPSALQLQSPGPTVPLRLGSGGVGEGDRSKGTITLDPGQGALVTGQLAWVCEPAPAP